MAQYDKLVVNKLLDAYESSLLSTGKNIRNINIELRFTKKNVPAYFNESSQEYEEIHFLMRQLEEKNFVTIIWKGKKVGHIIEKVQLRTDNIQEAYAYVKRVSKLEMEEHNIKMLREYLACVETPVCYSFVEYLLCRIQEHKSVKEFIELDKCKETKQLLDTIHAIEKNKDALYLREFSIKVLSDSKVFEQIAGKIASVFRKFKLGCDERDIAEILAEYNIYHTPNYVYLKGDVVVSVNDEELHLSSLGQGIGIAGDDISRIHFVSTENIKKVVTIENLTTYFRWNEKNSLIVYLGGYHNSARRMLLKEIYANVPQASYLHFGDIDAGGFEIFRDLCEKTEIPFSTYHMDLETLQKYEKYGKELTLNDRSRLERMKELSGMKELISYMLEHNVKLEQECVI